MKLSLHEPMGQVLSINSVLQSRKERQKDVSQFAWGHSLRQAGGLQSPPLSWQPLKGGLEQRSPKSFSVSVRRRERNPFQAVCCS